MGGISTLEELLREIAKERSKTIRKDTDASYSLRNRRYDPSMDVFWADLFKTTFGTPGALHLISSGSQDDMLFIVGQSTWRFAKPYLRVFRRCSPSIPQSNDGTVNWESTVYLNLITHCFVYVFTLGIFFPIDNFEDAFRDCDLRDSECLCVELTAYDQSGALQGVLFEGVVRYAVLKSAYDIDVYSRESWRFTSVREGSGSFDSAADVGCALPRTSVWMLARRSEGIAEVTIQQEVEDSMLLSGSATMSNSFFSHLRRLSIPSKVSSEADENICPEKDSKWSLTRRRPNIAYRSATSSPLHSYMYHPEQRGCPTIGNLVPHRSSEVGEVEGTGASQIHRLVAGERGKSRQCPFSTRISPFSKYRKAMSDSHSLNSSLERFRPSKKCIEIDSSTFEDEFNDQPLMTAPSTEAEMDASVEKQATFGQAWQWFKERRRITSTPIKAGVTYVSLPWHLIISDIFDAKKTPILTSTFLETLANMKSFHKPVL
ncbi:hypothetical protein TcWFU_010226 [Taenia crassiceps]|uniref:Uncharacterized protein n=1 Tax=Taenia crassiceps TaxID=6207 RepID=A0ABR4QUT6_9CEST